MIFDTEGIEAPKPPTSSDWYEHRSEVPMSDFDRGAKMVENAVRKELEEQAKAGRAELDAEHKKKYGFEPPGRATNEQVANIMDNKLLDGQGKRPTLHAKKTYSRPSERASAKGK